MEKQIENNVKIIINEILQPFQDYIDMKCPNNKVNVSLINAKVDERKIAWLLDVARKSFLLQSSLIHISRSQGKNIIVGGDIHGQFPDLLKIFCKLGFPDKSKYLFLGDYVDRGKQGIEVMLLLLCYKIIYPRNFFLLRGNHECQTISKTYGFFDECKRKYNIKMWKKFIDVFNCMPVAALIEERIFCMHGGISPHMNYIEDVLKIKKPCEIPEEGIMCDLLWADPDDEYRDGWNENTRGASYVFGTDVLCSFMMKNNLDLICRAHQVVEDGYKFFGGRKLVTIFSAPNYCGEFDNKGAILKITDDMECSFVIFE